MAESHKRVADFVTSIHKTAKGRIGTNDYATFSNNKVTNTLLKALIIELQKLNVARQKA